MEADSIMKLKKTIKKFKDNGDTSDIPTNMSNITNIDSGGVREESPKKWLGFRALPK